MSIGGAQMIKDSISSQCLFDCGIQRNLLVRMANQKRLAVQPFDIRSV